MRHEKYRKSGLSIYSTGSVLYSFGPHFPLAVWIHDGWACNSDSYSVRTTAHQSAVRALMPSNGRVDMPTEEICALASHAENNPSAVPHVVKRWTISVDELIDALSARMSVERLKVSRKSLKALKDDIRLERSVQRI